LDVAQSPHTNGQRAPIVNPSPGPPIQIGSAGADLANQPAGGPARATGWKYSPVMPRTEAEDFRNVEVIKIEDRETVHRYPEER